MRLMLLIIAMVLGSFILFNAFSRKRQKKQEAIHDEFEQTILENSQSQLTQMKRVEQMQQDHKVNKEYEPQKSNPFALNEDDPLLHDFRKAALSSQTAELTSQLNQEVEEPLIEDDQEEVQEVEEVVQPRPKTQGFIALTVIPKHSTQFSGIALQATLGKNHFRYGVQKLYHRHFQDNPSQPILYSVASLANPGYFEQAGISQQTFPGLLVYMLLDEVDDPVTTFEKMLTSARQLSASLQAELCDIKRQPITTALIHDLRNQAKAAISHHAMA